MKGSFGQNDKAVMREYLLWLIGIIIAKFSRQ
jgi:hypothetical protein